MTEYGDLPSTTADNSRDEAAAELPPVTGEGLEKRVLPGQVYVPTDGGRGRTHAMPVTAFYDPRLDLNGASILVTGGTGSFGKRFIRTVLDRFDPGRLIIYSRDELKQYEMQRELSECDHPSLRYFIGDVRDRGRLEMAMRDVEYVIHAAALKQVPVAEYNPSECLHTNVMGAENVVHAALHCGVKRVIALSTDKAANPVNLYGASKLASDKIFVAANNLAGRSGTRFSVVRYGNVVGSRGSVVPLYLRLKRENAPRMPVTDDRMTRFWITLQQGVDFVMSCLLRARGGEIFVPKIPSMKIVDLARMIAPEIPVEVVGIRPGEKLHEVLVTPEDARTTLEFDDHYVIQPVFKFWSDNGNGAHPGTATTTSDPGRPADEGFCYASDRNEDWIDESRLNEILWELRTVS